MTYREESFNKLLSVGIADLDKIIQGVPSYRITENLAYKQAFQFEPPQSINNQVMRSTDKNLYSYNSQGDLVADPSQSDIAYLTLQFGFIPPANAQPVHYNFSPKRKSSLMFKQ